MASIHARSLRWAAMLGAAVLASPVLRAQSPAAPANPDPASSYSLGLVFGNQLHAAGLGEGLVFDEILRGLKDGMAGKLMSPEDKERATQLVHAGRDSIASRNHAAAQEFLAKNKSAPGVVTTSSGLQYQVIAPGEASGAQPSAQDRVTVHYRGRLLDGTEFDSSDAHAQAATFSVGSVIKGWREALLLMKAGAKWRLFIPPELAYDMNSPPAIPPGSLLIFDVELLKVEPPPIVQPGAAPKAPKAARPTSPQPPPKPASGQ